MKWSETKYSEMKPVSVHWNIWKINLATRGKAHGSWFFDAAWAMVIEIHLFSVSSCFTNPQFALWVWFQKWPESSFEIGLGFIPTIKNHNITCNIPTKLISLLLLPSEFYTELLPQYPSHLRLASDGQSYIPFCQSSLELRRRVKLTILLTVYRH